MAPAPGALSFDRLLLPEPRSILPLSAGSAAEIERDIYKKKNRRCISPVFLQTLPRELVFDRVKAAAGTDKVSVAVGIINARDDRPEFVGRLYRHRIAFFRANSHVANFLSRLQRLGAVHF